MLTEHSSKTQQTKIRNKTTQVELTKLCDKIVLIFIGFPNLSISPVQSLTFTELYLIYMTLLWKKNNQTRKP